MLAIKFYIFKVYDKNQDLKLMYLGSALVLRTLDIRFERGDKGLGLSIAGGLGSTPYKPNDEGIFISRVTPGGPAAIAGLLKDDKVYIYSLATWKHSENF